VRWLLLRAPEQLDDAVRADLVRIRAADPALAAGHALVQRCRALLARRDAAALAPWLAAATTSALPPFVSLAAGLRHDLAAITNALRYPWSTGPVEGHVNRVKLIKRQGYGRAALPLLRARVLGPN
jgi:transposase